MRGPLLEPAAILPAKFRGGGRRVLGRLLRGRWRELLSSRSLVPTPAVSRFCAESSGWKRTKPLGWGQFFPLGQLWGLASSHTSPSFSRPCGSSHKCTGRDRTSHNPRTSPCPLVKQLKQEREWSSKYCEGSKMTDAFMMLVSHGCTVDASVDFQLYGKESHYLRPK